MLFKHNADRRHRIPRARYRVTNWPVYEAGLRRRGDLTLWLDEAALAGWSAPRRDTPGGQALYSDRAARSACATGSMVWQHRLRACWEPTRSLVIYLCSR